MTLSFEGEIIYWRGPAPFWYVPVPEDHSQEIKAISQFVTYGWGVIPVEVRIGGTTWKTSLFPKEGRYLVPVKVMVQRAESLKLGDTVSIQLKIKE